MSADLQIPPASSLRDHEMAEWGLWPVENWGTREPPMIGLSPGSIRGGRKRNPRLLSQPPSITRTETLTGLQTSLCHLPRGQPAVLSPRRYFSTEAGDMSILWLVETLGKISAQSRGGPMNQAWACTPCPEQRGPNEPGLGLYSTHWNYYKRALPSGWCSTAVRFLWCLF